MSFDYQQVAASQPHSRKLLLGEADTLDLVQCKLVSEHVRHAEVWCFQRKDGPLLRDLQTSLNISDRSQVLPLPSHGIFQGISKHFDEEGGDEFAKAIDGLGAQASNTFRPVQDTSDPSLLIERR